MATKNYGTNQMSGPSSDTPGQRTVSALAAEMESRDPSMAVVRAKGMAPSDPLTHEQLRTISGSKPTAFGMKPSTPTDSPKIPGTLDCHCDTYAKPKLTP